MSRPLIWNALAGAVIVMVAALFVGPVLSAECGRASFYCCEHHGRMTACREPFNENAMTAASNTLPCGTKVRVTNPKNGKRVTVRINDTGGFAKYGRVIDLSKAAFARLAPTSRGVIRVCLERIN